MPHLLQNWIKALPRRMRCTSGANYTGKDLAAAMTVLLSETMVGHQY